MGTDPRGDGVGVYGGSGAKSQPLTNLLLMIPGRAPLKLVLEDAVRREVEGYRHVLDKQAGDLLLVYGKPPFPLEILQEHHEPQPIDPTLIGEEAVFMGKQREMVDELLRGEILAHSPPPLGSHVP